MAFPARELAGTTAKAVGSFREAIQDLLVPELRALKASMDALRTEMQLRNEQQAKATEELNKRQTLVSEALGDRLTRSIEAMDKRQMVAAQALSDSIRAMDERQTGAIRAMDERQTETIRALDERQTKSTETMGARLTQALESLTAEMRLRDTHLSQKLDVAMDVRDRLAQVEARLPKQ